MTNFQPDPLSKKFQAEVDALVRKWTGDDEYEYWRRWKQLGSWGMNKTQGDVIRKAKLKKDLYALTGGACMDCRRDLQPEELQMHRLDTSFNRSRAHNFGYFEENLVLVCAVCHGERERIP